MWGAVSDPPPSALLRVSNVSKTFSVRPSGWRGLVQKPERIVVLRDVSFHVAPGEIFGLLGENGAGKTTLLHMLATLVQPDSGTVTIEGIDSTRNPMHARRSIGMCGSADRSFYYRLTLRENLRFFGSLCGLHGNALAARIDELLTLVELEKFADRTYGRCSSGIRQRANVARALIADPPLLLLDEPTRTVDPVHAHAIHRLVREQLAGVMRKTVVLATNVVEEAWGLCDRLCVLSEGRLGQVWHPNERAQPSHEELFRELAMGNA
jgi:ABC-2 type transport system ATP-binding protein